MIVSALVATASIFRTRYVAAGLTKYIMPYSPRGVLFSETTSRLQKIKESHQSKLKFISCGG